MFIKSLIKKYGVLHDIFHASHISESNDFTRQPYTIIILFINVLEQHAYVKILILSYSSINLNTKMQRIFFSPQTIFGNM